MGKLSPTTKDIALLQQLHLNKQLDLAPEFQRNSVWPPKAKSYLIDTIINDKPIPIFFLERSTSLQTGQPNYAVIDGQQRLRAIFDFLSDSFPLTETTIRKVRGKKYSQLPKEIQERILNYDLVVEELSGFTEKDIRDIFVRMNKYVVKLSPQEIRNARDTGKFKEFVDRLAKWPFWRDHGVFTAKQTNRMRNAEFVAELAILLTEGPQDKKGAIDLYYGTYRASFPEGRQIESRLQALLAWIKTALPDLRQTRYRKPTDLYSLIGALDAIASRSASAFKRLEPKSAGTRLRAFEKKVATSVPRGEAGRYAAASSRQTDNIAPRNTRIEVLSEIIRAPA